MATVRMYQACKKRSLKRGLREFYSGVIAPSMDTLKSLGIKELIKKSDLKGCSEAEKRRHLQEDRILRFLYIEN